MPALAGALAAALEASRAAADLLREELFRPGGPRGEPGKCPADVEAEDVIRAILLGAFPEHGFVAEERGELDRPGRDAGRHVWVVDPNDGTADFQRGFRGASVSIALLRAGVPVLGVVLAHTAPLGGEDLFAWAEGEGPLMRNGAPLPPLAAAPLGTGDVVLVSSAAPGRALAYATAVHPARFRPLTSIAYRLALAAAGEARAAVSLHHPRALDIAGGHALLRGAGGALLDEAGREVTYGPDGEGGVEFCFGGSPPAAAALARRPWNAILSAPWSPPPLSRPLAGGAVRDAARLSRAQGVLLGQLAGDALGSQVEFARPEEIARDHPRGVRDLADGGVWNTLAGQPTDDSELALALARALDAAGRFDAGLVVTAYADWLRTDPFDAGNTTRAALGPAAAARAARRPPAELAAAARAAALSGSKSNGALMRVSPLAVLGHAAPAAEVAAWAREDAALTHPNRTCLDASAVHAATIAFAVGTGADPLEVARRAEALAVELGAGEEVRAALAAARAGPPDFLENPGLVTVALQNAFFQLRHATSLEEGLVDTVGRGGDTDTNGAIAGALLGAVHGVGAVPQRWRSAVLSCWPVAGAPGVLRPRPPSCWPGDALVLAERLLHAGGGR